MSIIIAHVSTACNAIWLLLSNNTITKLLLLPAALLSPTPPSGLLTLLGFENPELIVYLYLYLFLFVCLLSIFSAAVASPSSAMLLCSYTVKSGKSQTPISWRFTFQWAIFLRSPFLLCWRIAHFSLGVVRGLDYWRWEYC